MFRSSVSVEWHEDRAVPIPITLPDFDGMDSIEDQAREALAGNRLGRFLDEVTFARYQDLMEESIGRVLGYVMDAKNPLQMCVCIAIASSNPKGLAKTLQEWADEFGVSKQDMQKGVKLMRARLNLRKNRPMQDEEACANMRAANYRPRLKLR